MYEYSSDYDTVAMNDQADKYADARHSDEVDHPADAAPLIACLPSLECYELNHHSNQNEI